LLPLLLFAVACGRTVNPDGWAGPLEVDGVLYVSIDSGKIAAVDPGDHSVAWVFPPNTDRGKKLDLDGIYAAPVVDGGTLYFGAYDGNVYALDTETGAELWRFETSDPIIGALVLDEDDVLYAGSTDGKLYAIDVAECTTSCPLGAVRTYSTGSSIWAAPAVTGDAVYVASMDGRLHILNRVDLTPVDGAGFKVDAGLLMDPLPAANGALFVGGINETLYALDGETGAEAWSFSAGNWFWGRPLIDHNTVYVPNLDGNVYALDLESGAKKWAFSAQAPVRSTPLMAGGVLVIVDKDGNVYGLDPETGTTIWGGLERPTYLSKRVLSDPLLLDDEVLIVAQGGDLCRLNPEDGSVLDSRVCFEVKP